jgi:hypothetical protein
MIGLSRTPTALRPGACSNEVCEPMRASEGELVEALLEPWSPPNEPNVEVIKAEGTGGR